jgi:hypothetical protein
MWSVFMARLAILAVTLGLALAGCNTSYNYFEEETTAAEGQDTTAFGTLLTMTGMVPKPKERIDYGPRAPVAIPGSTDLPPPGSNASAEGDVDFPVNPEERERQRRAKAAELSGEYAYELDGLDETRNARTDPGRIQALRREGGGRSERRSLIKDTGNQHYRVSREEMRITIRGNRDNVLLTEDGEPVPRKMLVQPPDHYRTPAEGAPLPEPGDIENSEWAKKRIYKVQDRRPARMLKDD